MHQFALAGLVCGFCAAITHASPSLIPRTNISSLTPHSKLDADLGTYNSSPIYNSSGIFEPPKSFQADGTGNLSSPGIEEKYTVTKQCPGITGQVAQQALADAATMAKLLLKNNNWQKPQYQDALKKYMGGNCLTGTYKDDAYVDGKNIKQYKDWINTVLNNVATSRWAWYDWTRGLIPWAASAFGSTTINLYCNGNYPTFSDGWKPTCQYNTYGWSHGGSTSPLSPFTSYVIGFCSQHFYNSFIPLSSMVKFAQSGRVDKTNEEALGSNYGRVAVHQLVELSGAVNLITTRADDQGSQAAADVASKLGCAGSPNMNTKNVISSLNNADNWAHWINAVYFQIVLDLKTVPQPGTYNATPGQVIQSYDCKGSSNCKYMDQSECTKAIAKIDDNTVYTKYMTRTQKSKGHMKGCMARFQCIENLCPPEGVKGSVIKERLNQIYTQAFCGTGGKCGSIYEDDYTQVTLNMCASCKDSG